MYSFKNGQGGVILRVKLLDATQSTGAGLTGLSNTSPGLVISTICDNEGSATAYTQAAGTIGVVGALGTYSAPTAGTCNFKEVDAVNHPGIYELQFLNSRFAVANAKSIIVSWSGVTGLAQGDIHIPLTDIDPFSRAALFQAQMTENYAADGIVPTVEQAILLIQQFLGEISISGTTWTTRKIDGVSTAAQYTINSATTPTSITRSA